MLLDVIVVGAGPAGLGTAIACQHVQDLKVGVIEAGKIGETFLNWHDSQRLLTPSFTTNGFGSCDLNAIHPLTSPAYTLHDDYPSGEGYAHYLRSVAAHFNVPVIQDTAVTEVTVDEDGYFLLTTTGGQAHARFLVWAGGEYSSPLLPGIPGRDLLCHSSSLHAWRKRSGSVVIIGGYESGIELACHHLAAHPHTEVTVVDPARPWEDEQADPSISIAPRTHRLLARASATGRLHFSPQEAEWISREGDQFIVGLSQRQELRADSAPIAATGYGPGLGPVKDLFSRRKDTWPLLTSDDESTLTPGLFLTGPAVRHEDKKFCFIYKYRQRFAYIAEVIAQRLGKDCSELRVWEDHGMLVRDLDCCVTDCAC